MGKLSWPPTTSRQQQVAPKISPALRVGPEWGRMRRSKVSPGVKPDCTLRLASTPIPIQRGPTPKPDRLLWRQTATKLPQEIGKNA